MSTDRATYLALNELCRRHQGPRAQRSGGADEACLTSYELRVFSQNGEDGVIAEVLRRIGVEEGYFVEFGIDRGHEGNCVALADLFGWRGLFIEADAAAHAALERKYRGTPAVTTRRARISAETIEPLFAAAGVPEEPDLLSIDIDGNDFWIWRAIRRYRPRVVVIEYNAALDPRSRLVQPYDADRGWDGSERYGASLGALTALGEAKGWRLVHSDLTGVNAFFVREDLAARMPTPGSVPWRGGNIFLTGYAHPKGERRWSYIDLEQQPVELLPAADPDSRPRLNAPVTRTSEQTGEH